MFNRYEIVYNDYGNEIIIAEFSGNMILTVGQALALCDIDMDEYAMDNGWDGYDWNSISIRFKDE